MRKLLLFAFLIVMSYAYSIMPFPGSNYHGDYPQSSVSSIYPRKGNSRRRELPQKVLAIMVEFQDVKFIAEPQYPDYLVHDKTYFEKHMLNVVDFWYDASHGQYEFEYDVYDRVVLDQNMLAYGVNDDGTAVVNMVDEMVDKIDPFINFNDYDAFIVFHAGAGQEAIGYDGPEELIWSTFINRQDLQDVLDPENDDYEGIETEDGTIVSEFSILPETEWVETFVPGEAPILNIFGVLLHEYGHQLGLPTLFDNVSSNGKSHGIGRFGIMGEGSWVANGNVPPLPCAWSRYYLGWENPVVVTEAALLNNLDHVLLKNSTNPKMYKIPISDKEYFLLENRQQNPDNSFESWKYELNESGDLGSIERPSFTFELSDDQEYYDYPNEDKPAFDFYKNRYRGCEWDFYMPGIGTSAEYVDNSGIFIWHIDENIIEANFVDNFDVNRPNGDAYHKGVDLEEADGHQDLDLFAGEFAIGSPYDSFRAGNNSYFGRIRNPETGEYSIPTAESYYGGVTAEVFDISDAGHTMTFSVRYPWVLTPDDNFTYEFQSKFSMMLIKSGGEKQFLQIQPTGELVAWDYNDYETTLASVDTVNYNAAYNPNNETVYVPGYSKALQRPQIFRYKDKTFLPILDPNVDLLSELQNYNWASHPIVNVQDDVSHTICCFNGENNKSKIVIFNEADEVENIYNFDTNFAGNSVLHNSTLYSIKLNIEGLNFLQKFDLLTENIEDIPLDNFPENQSIRSLVAGNISHLNFQGQSSTEDDFQLVVSTNENFLLIYDDAGQLFDGFPKQIEFDIISNPVLADVTGNGKLEIIYSGENGIAVYGYSGELLNSPIELLPDQTDEGISAGAIAIDFIGNSGAEIIGNYSLGRLNIYSEKFTELAGMPVTIPGLSQCPPTIEQAGDTVFVYVATEKGTIYRHVIPNVELDTDGGWIAEFGNLQRTGFGKVSTEGNKFESDGLYVIDQVYVYPNPYTNLSTQDNARLNVMVTEKADVTVRIYDIAANLLYEKTEICEPYLYNRDKFLIPVSGWASGIYFIVVEANGETKKIKFAIEK